MSGVLFEPDVAVATGLTQGCTPIGPVREVTDCRENIIVGLDERPALEALKEDIGEVLARDLRRIGGYIHVAFPVSGADRPDYLVRNLIAIDPAADAFAVGATVARGDMVMICRRDGQAAHLDLTRMLEDLGRRGRGVTAERRHLSLLSGAGTESVRSPTRRSFAPSGAHSATCP